MSKFFKLAAGVLGAAAVAAAALLLLNNAKRGACLKGEGRQAVEACTFLLDKYPAAYRAGLLSRRAALYAKLGRQDEGAADLKAVAALAAPGQADKALLLAAYESLVKFYADRADQAETRKYLELAAAAGSADPAVYVALAEEYSAEKRGAEALKLLEKARPLGKPGHPYYNAQASAYESAGDYAKAYDALKTGLTVNAPRPVLAATAKHLGLVCYELKRWQEAETCLSYALRAGAVCPECGLLLTTIRESLAPETAPAKRVKKKGR